MRVEISHTTVYGFRPALRGMRNPKNSHDRSDSCYGIRGTAKLIQESPDWFSSRMITVDEGPYIGPKDMKLVCALIRSGNEHRKCLRMVNIWVDLKLPRYMLVDLDTYKVGTTRNSESTRFKPRRFNSISWHDFINGEVDFNILAKLNELIYRWTEKKDKNAMVEFKRHLPEGYLQKSTYHLNYEVALNILHQRLTHPLPEFKILCDWILSLPYMKEFWEAYSYKRRPKFES